MFLKNTAPPSSTDISANDVEKYDFTGKKNVSA